MYPNMVLKKPNKALVIYLLFLRVILKGLFIFIQSSCHLTFCLNVIMVHHPSFSPIEMTSYRRLQVNHVYLDHTNTLTIMDHHMFSICSLFVVLVDFFKLYLIVRLIKKLKLLYILL
jgi:hypothetical protein